MSVLGLDVYFKAFRVFFCFVLFSFDQVLLSLFVLETVTVNSDILNAYYSVGIVSDIFHALTYMTPVR